MNIGVYADPHVTKNMRAFQDIWDMTVTKSIYHMYDTFDSMGVESVICLGDFFDAPRIEAKHMQLVMPLLKHINERTYPTYLLLGNHEIDSEESNILDFLSMYDNIIPMTELSEVEGMLFIPYNVNPSGLDMRDKIVFTHHDIYGSELAGGKTKAFFGIDPAVFKDASLVMNGHVHLSSRVSSNIINVGSLLVSSQGELRVGEYPQYYILDTKYTDRYTSFGNEHSMIYLTVRYEDIDKVLASNYDRSHLVLKVEYQGDIPTDKINTLHTSYRKLIDNIGETEDIKVKTSNFDMKNYLIEYIKKDAEVPDKEKEAYTSIGLEMLS